MMTVLLMLGPLGFVALPFAPLIVLVLGV